MPGLRVHVLVKHFLDSHRSLRRYRLHPVARHLDLQPSAEHHHHPSTHLVRGYVGERHRFITNLQSLLVTNKQPSSRVNKRGIEQDKPRQHSRHHTQYIMYGGGDDLLDVGRERLDLGA